MRKRIILIALFFMLITIGYTENIFAFLFQTNISKTKISKIEVVIKAGGKPVAKIIPGLTYQIDIDIFDHKNKEVKNPNLDKLIWESPNSTLVLKNIFILGSFVEASKDTLELAYKGNFQLSVSVKDNPFPAQLVTWPINWEEFNTISFKGQDGFKGTNGRDGSIGGRSKYTCDGGDGGDGLKGHDGRAGENVQLIIAYYDINGLSIDGLQDSKVMLLYEMESKTLSISRIQAFSVNTSGGQGGDGGQGGAAGRAGEYREDGTSTFNPPGSPRTGEYVKGKDGKPGLGGDGGNGGNAGNITIWYYDNSLLDNIQPIMNGGAAGQAGQAGQRAFSGPFNFGMSPRNGFSGKPGTFEAIEKSFEEIMAILKTIDHRYFDINRVIR